MQRLLLSFTCPSIFAMDPILSHCCYKLKNGGGERLLTPCGNKKIGRRVSRDEDSVASLETCPPLTPLAIISDL